MYRCKGKVTPRKSELKRPTEMTLLENDDKKGR